MNDETTLAQVFSKPPPYTPQELATVVAHYRASREQFLAGKKEEKAKPAKKPKGEAVEVSVVDIEL